MPSQIIWSRRTFRGRAAGEGAAEIEGRAGRQRRGALKPHITGPRRSSSAIFIGCGAPFQNTRSQRLLLRLIPSSCRMERTVTVIAAHSLGSSRKRIVDLFEPQQWRQA
jgi:hypothetical protein